VVVLLVLDIANDFVDVGGTHRECAVSVLPVKVIDSMTPLDPDRRASLQLLDYTSNWKLLGQRSEDMDVILVAAKAQSCGPPLWIHILHVAVHLLTSVAVSKER